MQSRIFKASIASVIFILLIILALAFLEPICRHETQAIRVFAEQTFLQLEQKTGLSFSYRSISPSILSKININDTSVLDSSSKEILAKIKRATLSYKIGVGIKKITLNGIEMHFNAKNQSQIAEKIASIVQKIENKNLSQKDFSQKNQNLQNQNEKSATNINTKDEIKTEFQNTDFASSAKNLIDTLNFDISIKNFLGFYSDQKMNLRAELKSAEIKKDIKNDFLSVKISGNVRHTKFVTKDEMQIPFSIGASYFLNGTIFSTLDGSRAQISLKELSDCDVSLNFFEFFLSFSDGIFLAQTPSQENPLNFSAFFDSKNFNAEAILTAENFFLFDLLRIPKKNKHEKFFEPLCVNVSASAKVDLSPIFFKSGLPKFSYDLKSSAHLARRKNICEFFGNASFFGDEKNIREINVALESEIASAQFLGNISLPKNLDIRQAKPSGVLTIEHLFLPTKSQAISCEIYVEPMDLGFFCFSPQIFLGDTAFTAFQANFLPGADSIDFTAEFDDYSHFDYDEPGHIRADGSFLFGSQNYFQLSADVSDFFVDSLLRFVGFCILNPGTSSAMNASSKNFKNFVSSGEFYLLTDYSNVSYNAPYFVAANVQKEGEVLVAIFDGTKEEFRVSNVDFVTQGIAMQASGVYDFSSAPDSHLFSLDLLLNSIPYFFNGSFSNRILRLSGDYNFDALISFEALTEGFLRAASFPFSFGGNTFVCSLDSNFVFLDRDEWTILIANFEAEDAGATISFSPHIAFSASINQYGVIFDSISYTDKTSVLSGTGNLLLNKINGIFENADLVLNAENPLSSEKIFAECHLQNEFKIKIPSKNWKRSISILANAQITNLPTSIFAQNQNPDDTLSANCSVTGTLENPKIELALQNISLSWWGIPFVAHGNAIYENSILQFSDVAASWYTFKVENANASFDCKNFSANASAVLGGSFWGSTLSAPFNFSMTNNGQKIFDSFNMIFDFPTLSGSLLKKTLDLKVEIAHRTENTTILTAGGEGFRAAIENGGLITLRTGEKAPFQINLDGVIGANYIDLSASNFILDLGQLSSFVRFSGLEFNSGEIRGNFRAAGIPSDPDLTGAFSVTNFSLKLPNFLAKPLETEKITIAIGHGSILIPDLIFKSAKAKISFSASFFLDRWRIGESIMRIKTLGPNLLRLNLNIPLLKYSGDAGIDARLTFGTDGFGFNGDLSVQNGDFDFLIMKLFGRENDVAENPFQSNLKFFVNANLIFGNRLQFQVSPLLRGLVVPGNSLSFIYDGESENFSLKGDVELRGGDIAWLNRNFYMREGKVSFNENQDKTDPRITVRAEARERDSEGDSVRIILSATNQNFSAFNPVLTASPAKSEREIMEILGQIITADSENIGSFLVSGGDYFVQTMIVRRIENALRKLCHFDIFSVRTMVLQNAVKQGLNLNRAQKQFTIGNFFDGSTVYIGKYFGSTIYVDAMMHWSYDENKTNNAIGGLVFQPEIGLELNSPFVGIRLGVAPDIEAIKNNFWLPSTSITLSWKINF